MKGNQPTLKQDIADPWEEDTPSQAEQVGRHGDCVEVRRIRVSDELADYSDWPHLARMCRVERIVHGKDRIRREWAYAVTSLDARKAGPARLPNCGGAIRVWTTVCSGYGTCPWTKISVR